MEDTMMTQGEAARRIRAVIAYDETARGEAGRVLGKVLDDAYWAQRRLQFRAPVFGLHGEDFDARYERVRRMVIKYNNRTVRVARRRAIKAGWTEAELKSSGLEMQPITSD